MFAAGWCELVGTAEHWAPRARACPPSPRARACLKHMLACHTDVLLHLLAVCRLPQLANGPCQTDWALAAVTVRLVEPPAAGAASSDGSGAAQAGVLLQQLQDQAEQQQAEAAGLPAPSTSASSSSRLPQRAFSLPFASLEGKPGVPKGSKLYATFLPLELPPEDGRPPRGISRECCAWTWSSWRSPCLTECETVCCWQSCPPECRRSVVTLHECHNCSEQPADPHCVCCSCAAQCWRTTWIP